MNRLDNYFKNINTNRIVQSFLIGNTTFESIKNDLETVLSNYIFLDKIKIDNNPDIYILTNENKSTGKEDIKELLNNISETSQFSNKKVYIIDEFEKLNESSVNAILKTLEEPQNNIYAFLITKNIDSIHSTISSRCQKIFVSSFYDENEFEDDIINIGDELINIIESNKLRSIALNNDIYNRINERTDFQNILKYLLVFYEKSLQNVINNDNDKEKENIYLLSKKIIVINNNINRLNNYLNKNLSIDRFIIEMWRCNNENSSSGI